MSRIIKFRAWDKKNNIMMLWNNKFIEYIVSIFNKQRKDINYKHLEFMQYTGLKDKNGKEIYEGDIVRFRKDIGLIIYCGDSFSIDNQKNDLEDLHFYQHNHEVEVIGNIYENSGLVEE